MIDGKNSIDKKSLPQNITYCLTECKLVSEMSNEISNSVIMIVSVVTADMATNDIF